MILKTNFFCNFSQIFNLGITKLYKHGNFPYGLKLKSSLESHSELKVA